MNKLPSLTALMESMEEILGRLRSKTLDVTMLGELIGAEEREAFFAKSMEEKRGWEKQVSKHRETRNKLLEEIDSFLHQVILEIVEEVNSKYFICKECNHIEKLDILDSLSKKDKE